MKRRNFIHRSVVGATGAVISSSSIASLLGSCTGPSKEIYLAIIGCDNDEINRIAESVKNIPDVKLKYVFDFDLKRSAGAAQLIQRSLDYLPEQVSDMEIIFNERETDGVFIFLPEHWRALAAIKACRARKDVYVKSLPAHSIWEGQQMEKAADKYKRVVQCGFPFRSSSSVVEARDYILSGKLGQIVHINIFGLNEPWFSEDQAGSDLPESLDWDGWLGPASYRPYNPAIYYSENTPWKKVFWDFNSGRMTGISHALDLARMVIGDPGHPSSVYGYASRQTDKNENMLPERQVVTYNYEKFTMNCEIGSGYNYMKNAPVTFKGDENPQQWLFRSERVEIYGTKGLMYLDSKEGSWLVYGFGGDKTGKIYSDISMRTGQVEILHKEGVTDHPELHIGNFIDCIRSRNLPSANIKQAHLSSTLVHLGNIACRAGNRQLLFDTGKEIFIDNDEANRLLKNEYRDGYEIPVKV